jgi:hypothetical protein
MAKQGVLARRRIWSPIWLATRAMLAAGGRSFRQNPELLVKRLLDRYLAIEEPE